MSFLLVRSVAESRPDSYAPVVWAITGDSSSVLTVDLVSELELGSRHKGPIDPGLYFIRSPEIEVLQAQVRATDGSQGVRSVLLALCADRRA